MGETGQEAEDSQDPKRAKLFHGIRPPSEAFPGDVDFPFVSHDRQLSDTCWNLAEVLQSDNVSTPPTRVPGQPSSVPSKQPTPTEPDISMPACVIEWLDAAAQSLEILREVHATLD